MLGSFVQAWLAYYEEPPSLADKPNLGTFIRGFAYAMVVAVGTFYGWLLLLTGGVLTFAGAMVAIIVVVR
jgi:hypothetical protein